MVISNLNMEKIQYSLIYFFYKTHAYKTGNGYIYRANQSMSLMLTALLTILFCGITGKKVTNPVVYINFILICFIIFFFLERNVSRQKLFRHRSTYLNRSKYLSIFFGCVVFIVIISIIVTMNRQAL